MGIKRVKFKSLFHLPHFLAADFSSYKKMSEDDPFTARMKEKFTEEYKKVFDEGKDNFFPKA